MNRADDDRSSETRRRFELEAAPLLEQLAEVRSLREYCRQAARRHAPWRSASPVDAEHTPALDALERDTLRRLASLRARFGLVVH
jgi:hypothetical protein